MLPLKSRDREQRRRRARDETNAVELDDLDEADVVSAGEGKDSGGGMLLNGRDSNGGD